MEAKYEYIKEKDFKLDFFKATLGYLIEQSRPYPYICMKRALL